MQGRDLREYRLSLELSALNFTDLLAKYITRNPPYTTASLMAWEKGRAKVPQVVVAAIRNAKFVADASKYPRRIRGSKSVKLPRVCGDIAYIPLSKGMEAIVDSSDVPILMNSNWCLQRRCYPDGSVRSQYAVTQFFDGKKQSVRMHNVVFGHIPHGYVVDHINGNSLDNRRSNLRLATYHQNNCNSKRPRNNKSGVKGVSWVERDKRWRASIGVKGKSVYLGYFVNIEDAALAYERAAKRYHGHFARLK